MNYPSASPHIFAHRVFLGKQNVYFPVICYLRDEIRSGEFILILAGGYSYAYEKYRAKEANDFANVNISAV